MVGIETTAPETLEQGECRIHQTKMVELHSGAVVRCDDVVVGDESDASLDLRALLRRVGDSFDAMLRSDLTLLPPDLSVGNFATNHATE